MPQPHTSANIWWWHTLSHPAGGTNFIFSNHPVDNFTPSSHICSAYSKVKPLPCLQSSLVPRLSLQTGLVGLPPENRPLLPPTQHLQQGQGWGSEPRRRTHRFRGTFRFMYLYWLTAAMDYVEQGGSNPDSNQTHLHKPSGLPEHTIVGTKFYSKVVSRFGFEYPWGFISGALTTSWNAFISLKYKTKNMFEIMHHHVTFAVCGIHTVHSKVGVKTRPFQIHINVMFVWSGRVPRSRPCEH